MKHGYHGSPTYISWMSMKARCNNPKHPMYGYYGGRGIKVCAQWNKFRGFLEDMGERPTGYQLSRIDVNGNYDPSNCQWTTEMVQQSRIRWNKYLEYEGKRMTYSQWARFLEIPPNVITCRVSQGWTVERILATPYEPRMMNAT